MWSGSFPIILAAVSDLQMDPSVGLNIPPAASVIKVVPACNLVVSWHRGTMQNIGLSPCQIHPCSWDPFNTWCSKTWQSQPDTLEQTGNLSRMCLLHKNDQNLPKLPGLFLLVTKTHLSLWWSWLVSPVAVLLDLAPGPKTRRRHCQEPQRQCSWAWKPRPRRKVWKRWLLFPWFTNFAASHRQRSFSECCLQTS